MAVAGGWSGVVTGRIDSLKCNFIPAGNPPVPNIQGLVTWVVLDRWRCSVEIRNRNVNLRKDLKRIKRSDKECSIPTTLSRTVRYFLKDAVLHTARYRCNFSLNESRQVRLNKMDWLTRYMLLRNRTSIMEDSIFHNWFFKIYIEKLVKIIQFRPHALTVKIQFKQNWTRFFKFLARQHLLLIQFLTSCCTCNQ